MCIVFLKCNQVSERQKCYENKCEDATAKCVLRNMLLPRPSEPATDNPQPTTRFALLCMKSKDTCKKDCDKKYDF